MAMRVVAQDLVVAALVEDRKGPDLASQPVQGFLQRRLGRLLSMYGIRFSYPTERRRAADADRAKRELSASLDPHAPSRS